MSATIFSIFWVLSIEHSPLCGRIKKEKLNLLLKIKREKFWRDTTIFYENGSIGVGGGRTMPGSLKLAGGKRGVSRVEACFEKEKEMHIFPRGKGSAKITYQA